MRRALGRSSVPSRCSDIEAFIALSRQEITRARIKLVSSDHTPEQDRELWQIVDCLEWLIKMLAPSYEAELEQIDRELEARLRC